MTDAEHAAVLRRLIEDDENQAFWMYGMDEERSAIERSIVLLEQWHDFTELAKSMADWQANRAEQEPTP